MTQSPLQQLAAAAPDGRNPTLIHMLFLTVPMSAIVLPLAVLLRRGARGGDVEIMVG
ncbi:MAG: hypothetical protein ACR2MQ_12910 [Gemmatimonadaceae bacterium]